MTRGCSLAVAILAALSLVATVYGAVPATFSAAPFLLSPPPSLSPVQVLELGGRQLCYTGDAPLQIEPGAYWDAPPASAQTTLVVDSAGPHLLVQPGPADEVRLIVQLEGEPLAARKAALRTVEAVQEYAAGLRHTQAAVLQALRERGIAVRVRHRYVYAFQGLALTALARDKEAIARVPGVRGVYPDYQMQALLPESVPLVGAPAVWAKQDAGGQPVTGSGVRVAVADSGIDYNHPDLGGPGFPNTRVITGYNFVSDTVDPWDDMGHGTYVAGIVGASGHLTGVAPTASLMAYKVVDARLGYAQTSDTIAAVERALDPDGDPGTDDAAHVLNISLGGPGDPDDPLSQACDNAVQAGVVVVVGAGNSGPRYQTLTSPGLARRVLGVGATSKTDGLWNWSSRGPVPGSWAIKPDLVAPGVSISSTVPGGYSYGVGTSASTAHVAGAAALLNQLHPAWPPAWVQAALMNTAKDLGRSPYEQGAGRLQVDQAAATPALILPPSLSLGRVTGDLPVWTRQEVLTVHNVSTATVTYTLSTAGSFPAGVTIQVSPTQIVISPDASSNVSFTLSVATATVPDQQADPFAYWGALQAIPTGLSAPALRVPFAFIKASLLRLHVDEPGVSVMFLRDDPLQSRYAMPGATTSDHLLAPDTYDVVVQYPAPYAYILHTVTLPPSGFVELTVPRSQASHQVRIAFSDEAGQTATPNHALHRFMRSGNGWIVSEVAPINEIVRFSDLPNTYMWERTVACADPLGEAYRQWHGRAEGIDGDLEFLTDPADLERVDHPLRPAPGETAYTFSEMIGYATPDYAWMVGPTSPAVPLPYTRRAYYRSPPAGHELYMLRLALPEPPPGDFAGTLMSPWLQLDADRHLAWGQPLSPSGAYYRVPAGGTEPLGLGPIHWFARFANDAPDRARLVPAVGDRLFYRAYQGGDVSWELRQPYELWQAGALVQAGEIGASTGGNQALISLPASGIYSMTFPFTYTLGATDVVTAHGRVVAEFDTSQYQADADPPFVKVLRLLAGGQPVDVASGPVELRLVVSDMGAAAPAVTVAYDVGDGWLPVAVVQVGDEYVANLPVFEDGTAVHLRIAAADDVGNTLTHFLEPAYLVRWKRVYLPVFLKEAIWDW